MAYKYFQEDTLPKTPVLKTSVPQWGYMNAPISCLIGAEQNFVGSLDSIMNYAIGKYLDSLLEDGYEITEAKDMAKKYFDLISLGDEDECLKTAKELKGKASIGIKTHILVSAIEQYDEMKGVGMNEIYLLAFMALKSIFREYSKRNTKYASTTKSVLLARMQGYADIGEMQKAEASPSPLFRDLEINFKKQRYWKRFIDELCERYHMGYYANGKRGFCFSFTIFHDEIAKRVKGAKEQLERQRGK